MTPATRTALTRSATIRMGLTARVDLGAGINRRQQQLLLAITRDEVLRHHQMVLT